MRHLIALLSLIPLIFAPLGGLPTAHAQRVGAPAAPPGSAPAALSSGYELSWYTIAGGAAISAGGSLALSGSIGQAEAGALSGGAYSLNGGFWDAAAPAPDNIYLPLVRK